MTRSTGRLVALPVQKATCNTRKLYIESATALSFAGPEDMSCTCTLHVFVRPMSSSLGPASRSINLKNVLRPRAVRVDQNAPKVGMRPRVGILSSAPSRRAIASVHRGRTCRDLNGRKNARRCDLRCDLTLDLQRISFTTLARFMREVSGVI